MPNRDGTGPLGKGPRTGRGLGRCAEDNKNNEPLNRGNGRGKHWGNHAGRGFGHGQGWRHRFDDE